MKTVQFAVTDQGFDFRRLVDDVGRALVGFRPRADDEQAVITSDDRASRMAEDLRNEYRGDLFVECSPARLSGDNAYIPATVKISGESHIVEDVVQNRATKACYEIISETSAD